MGEEMSRVAVINTVIKEQHICSRKLFLLLADPCPLMVFCE